MRAGAGGLLLLALGVLPGCRSLPLRSPPTPEAVVARSIAYHDPYGLWGTRPFHLEILESRPGGPDRTTRVSFDGRVPSFDLERRRGERVMEGRIAPGQCFWNLVAGDFSSEEVTGLSCESLERTRDYYLFLWGLPMKLRDPGTRLGPVTRVRVDGARRLRLRVSWDPEIGTDVWDLDFDPCTGALAGYRFFHDEAAGDGEWIALEGELEGAGLRLPRARTWFTNDADELLGEDRLVAIE